jgi:DNA processing protein
MQSTLLAAVRQVARDDPAYPRWLRQIFDPPLALWLAGTLLPEEGARAIAVVGPRAASPLALAFARALAADLASAGVTIVSGLARGVDTAAHKGALDAGGRTVAVLGSGLDRLYPKENAPLAQAIACEGAVVSEFPPGTEPHKHHFPRRNRTIAGWSRGVVVVEAGERSGALITARCALESGREVMAVPGHPSDPAYAGTNALLRDGAVLVRDASDVLAEIGIERPDTPPAPTPRDEVLSALRRGVPASLEELAGRVACPVSQLLARLTELELSGGVRRVSGGLFLKP